jgi:predicted nucleic acid-binding protein
MSGVLLDTSLLIDYLRAVPKAVEYLETSAGDLSISALTVAELHAGARGEAERVALRDFTAGFDVIAADGAVCELGGDLRAQYGRSHGTDLVDAILAATSLLRQMPLVTLNRKHFPMLRNVIVPYIRPSSCGVPRKG